MSPTDKELRTIFDNMPDAYYRADLEGRGILASPSVFDLLGYMPEELVGQPISKLYDEPERRQEMLESLARNGGRLKDYEIILRHKDGRRLWISLNVQFSYDEEGSVAGVEGFCRDISEKKAATERLAQSEQKLRAIFDHLLDVYYRTDLDGRLVMVSPSSESLLGYAPEELLGRQLSELYTDTSMRGRFVEELQAQGGSVYGFENKLRRKDGTEIWAIASSKFYWDENGNIAGVEGIVKDITARKNAEEETEQYNRKMQEALRDLETISYSVAHDLRAPLRAINGHAHILLEEFASALGYKGASTIGLINANVQRMAELIEALLSFARAGQTQTTITSFDMRTLVLEVIKASENPLIDFRIGELPRVQADRSLIRSVVSNLIDNAIKFTRRQKHPTIEIGFTEWRRNEHAFFVRDNGIGFDQRYAKKLFSLFERLHTIPEYTGTGVGLAIVERIVCRHGGQVWAEGKEGKGATFYFSLPSSSTTNVVGPAGAHLSSSK